MKTQKTMLRIAFENFFITGFGSVISKVFGIASTFILLGVLAPYEYGLWKLILSVVSGVGIIGLSGISGLIIADIARAIGRGDEAYARYILRQSIRVLMLAAFIATIVLVVAAPFISEISGIGLTTYLLILSSTVLFGGCLQVLQIIFQAHLQPVRALVLKNASAITYVTSLIVLVPFLHLGVMGVVVAYAISFVVPIVLFAPYMFQELFTVWKQQPVKPYTLKALLWTKGRWSLATDYVSIIVGVLWPWITGYYLSISEVGYASLGLLFSAQLASILPMQYVLRSILPRFSNENGRLQSWVVRALRHSLWMHGVIAVVVLIAVYLIVPILFPQYVPGIKIFEMLLWAVPFAAFNLVLSEWFYAVGKQKELFLTTSIPKILVFFLLPFLLITFGIAGFAVWYVLSSAVVAITRFFYLTQMENMSIPLQRLLIPDKVDFDIATKIVQAVLRLRSDK